MANDIRNMALIAKELGLSDEAEEYNTWFTQVKEAINSKLWCEEDGF
jgi:ABC-type Fe3+-hydroxamate transport system substrate-binding protein